MLLSLSVCLFVQMVVGYKYPFLGKRLPENQKKTLIQLLILYMNFNALLVGVTCARSTPRYNHSI